MDKLLLFHTAIHAGKVGTVDRDKCVIHGVSLITGNTAAEGHDMDVDDTTIQQLHALAKAKGKVPVNLDHGSGIEKTCGWVENFSVDGNKLRGDLHLLKNHGETPLMLERAEEMPDCFGLSAAFKGKGVLQASTKRKAARAEKLLSFDCVTRPAANASLFSAKDDDEVDTTQNGMANNSNKNADPTLAEVLAAITKIGERQTAMEAQLEGLASNDGGTNNAAAQDPAVRARLEQLNEATDAQLAQLNLTRAEVDAAVDEYNASVQADPDADGEGADPDAGGDVEGADAGADTGAAAPSFAGSPAGAGAATAQLRALTKAVIELKAERDSEKRAAIKRSNEVQFAEVNGKIDLIATQRDKAIELAEGLIAENEALRVHVKTGVRPVRGSTESGIRLFSANDEGELHPFQKRIKELVADKTCKNEAEAILFASREDQTLHMSWLEAEGERRRTVRMQQS